MEPDSDDELISSIAPDLPTFQAFARIRLGAGFRSSALPAEIEMLSVKLFATLAILQVSIALLESRTPSKSVDVYFHATYFVIGHIHLMGLMAVASAFFALVYLTASRWALHPLNNSLGIAHFVFVLIGCASLSIAFFSIRSATASGAPVSGAVDHWQFRALLVGVFCFLLGCATLAMNCTWTAIAALRAQSQVRPD
ncbi:MAG: cbb3-type cytochrome c oxidase subunit I [Candidatus Acidiferrum sp.]|jgi:heme/copper-type cytochrome/quinol oxidase subunit 1